MCGAAMAWSAFESATFRRNSTFVQKDGYVYIHGRHGLLKIGTGHHGTIVNHIYVSNPSYRTREKGWLAIYGNKLFYRSSRIGSASFVIIDAETLQVHQFFF
jgi:hypothetical protein